MSDICQKKIIELYKKIWLKGNKTIYEISKNEQVPFNELAHFVSIEGKNYRNKEVRLLVIGRAVNGWMSTASNNADDYAKEIYNLFSHKGFDWVVEDNGTLYNKNDKDGKKGDYCLSSPFWYVIKAIYESLTASKAEGKWVENIAWTNLYKIAPTHTGNPHGKMLDIQKTECIDMLKSEIEYYNPTHILALTGWKWWMEDFKEVLTGGYSVIGTNVLRGASKNKVYLEAVGKVGNIPVAIACRPEWRPKDKYLEDILKAFPKLLKP